MSVEKDNVPKERDEKLRKRTIQVIGFLFAMALTIFKLLSGDADIPWWVIFGFFGFGASAEIDFTDLITRGKK